MISNNYIEAFSFLELLLASLPCKNSQVSTFAFEPATKDVEKTFFRYFLSHDYEAKTNILMRRKNIFLFILTNEK